MFNIIKKNRAKVFCIGANKTGTTSMERALLDLGYNLGNVNKAQGLIENYKNRDFSSIVDFCKSAEAFQDAPFSWHYTFMFMDQAFPNSKFILTLRDNEDEWCDSFIKFQSKLFGTNGNLPNVEELKNAKRTENRTVWDNMNVRHIISNGEPYNKQMLKNYYLSHNRVVLDYFRFKSNLLVINIKQNCAYQEFCQFIDVNPLYDKFPWENKTEEI